MVRIVRIVERAVPMASDIRNAVIDFSRMTASAVAVVSDVVRGGQPLVGFGFNSNGRYAPSGILRERMIPRLLDARPETLQAEDGTNIDPVKCRHVMMTNEKPGGHGERSVAVGTIDMALWDLAAKIEDRPLYRLLADRYNDGRFDPKVEVYAAGGYYYPGKGVDQLRDEIRGYLDMGFEAVKIKIGGAPLEEDVRRIEAVLDVVGGEGRRLAVDANGRFSLSEAIRYAEILGPYRLKWYEEPGDPLDYALHSAVAEVSTVPVATGENLFSTVDARNLIRYGGLRPDRDVLQFDPVLSYGLVEYLGTLEMLARHGWSPRRCVPHGGHPFGLHIAAGLGLGGNEAYPKVFQPFGRFAAGTTLDRGFATLPEAPGIGYERVPGLCDIFRSLVE